MSKSLVRPPPHSWAVNAWPVDVWPGDAKTGRHVCHEHQDALLAEGALARVGRTLIVFGGAYSRWLAKQSHRVTNYSIAPNSAQHAAKRFGRATR